MNTTSLLLTGRTAADISLLPQRQAASLTTIYHHKKTAPSSSSSPRKPAIKRTPTSTRDSPGWYNTEGGMTLDDFAARLNTTLSRFEQWQGKCAQSVVMALMRPTPIMLFVLNPVALMIWLALVGWWLWG
ncbi:hypothetical protein BAUCODRAFT_152212 [Baudoinia panamericana UAMH 10762]|uniref:Uncharacterized protein n=1 Tax=Baudoinia panamericana (strain UAMH 10762) TaxID=717646 RepID=M2MKJ0_BAUPA|nr:uncharacterized protein BAUCODRAFT_152212 [Baudoinia panamericana UAMH 10762]EMC91848.1 hypothetical protein BAUCODRAFT_152212 [Baudoinia panamericana UAMH 10762]